MTTTDVSFILEMLFDLIDTPSEGKVTSGDYSVEYLPPVEKSPYHTFFVNHISGYFPLVVSHTDEVVCVTFIAFYFAETLQIA